MFTEQFRSSSYCQKNIWLPCFCSFKEEVANKILSSRTYFQMSQWVGSNVVSFAQGGSVLKKSTFVNRRFLVRLLPSVE